MKYLTFCLMILATLMISSCDPEPDAEKTTSIELNFKGTFGDELLLMFEEYEYEDGKKMFFNEFQFYISDVSLISAGLEVAKTKLLDVDLIDLGYDMSNPALAEQGQTLVIRDVPIGEYTGISIGFGVTADLNRTEPADYGSEHPLKSNHWSAWSSYIFSVIEGAADFDDNGMIVNGGADSESFSYHSGTDDNFVTGLFNKNVILKEESIETLNFEVDAQKLFRNNNPEFDSNNDGFLDIQDFPGTHSDTKQTMFNQIMRNFTDAVDL